MKHTLYMYLKNLEKTLYPTWFRWNITNCSTSMRRNQLYIPHGSDETKSLLPLALVVISFISHMVQMKRQVITYYTPLIFPLYPTWFRWNSTSPTYWKGFERLYIPHGSDETNSATAGRGNEPDFISHMVQMKHVPRAGATANLHLYIPHGSDETQTLRGCQQAWLRFISHMVQMKLVLIINTNNSAWALYPTWFRWNFPPVLLLFVLIFFISHMVQMKRYRQILYWACWRTLYPTWFRWNQLCYSGQRQRARLYIPHGSDETCSPCRCNSKPTSLYPTWFRWNANLAGLSAGLVTLYIPHGSDETRADNQYQQFCMSFISHMVQMKLPSSASTFCINFLYIPHGSDETLQTDSILSLLKNFISHMVQMKQNSLIS